MSKVAIKGNASGTGTFTIAAPDSNDDRTLTLPDEAGTVLTSASDVFAPHFCIESGSQSISPSTWTKISFNTTIWDDSSVFDTTTNYRFTVPSGQAGKYILTSRIHLDNVTDTKYGELAWYINGSNPEKHRIRDYQASSIQWVRMQNQVALNLSDGDYVEVYVITTNASTTTINFGQFSGYKIG